MGNLFSGPTLKEPSTVEECDSTWASDSEGGEEDEEEEEVTEKDGGEEQERKPGGSEEAQGTDQSDHSTAEQNIRPKRSFYAARDLFKYRHQYPNCKDPRGQNDFSNLKFYMNKISFKPDGVFIEDILSLWKCDYEKLEHNHTYIQWLFPLREQGLNFYAKELTWYEIEEFKKTKEATKRFKLAYKMMLDFFGLKLLDKDGNIARATNWQERFQHLNESQHNYLRITRILKSLGELGYEHFKPPLVEAFLKEAIVENTIPNMKQSALEYFVYTIKDRKQRRRLLRFAYHHYQPPEQFIWGPPKCQNTEQNKSLKKTTLSNRSLKKLSQKSKDHNIEHELDRTGNSSTGKHAAGSGQLENVISQTTDTNVAGNDVKTIATNNSPNLELTEHTIMPPVTDETISLGDDIKELHSEDPSKECNLEELVKVDNSDEGSKDCLCSLSPVTNATPNVTVET